MISSLTIICNNISETGEWPTPWTKSMIITLPKNGNIQICNNYRTICLISHPSKVMLKVLLNRLKPQAEEIIAEEQAGFRTGRSTTEHIFNLRIICEKYLQHQQDIYHVFIDFKKAFDRVWHVALWAIMRQKEHRQQLDSCTTSPIRTCYQRSLHQWHYWRLVPHHSRCPPRVHIIPYTLQHLPREDYVRCA